MLENYCDIIAIYCIILNYCEIIAIIEKSIIAQGWLGPYYRQDTRLWFIQKFTPRSHQIGYIYFFITVKSSIPNAHDSHSEEVQSLYQSKKRRLMCKSVLIKNLQNRLFTWKRRPAGWRECKPCSWPCFELPASLLHFPPRIKLWKLSWMKYTGDSIRFLRNSSSTLVFSVVFTACACTTSNISACSKTCDADEFSEKFHNRSSIFMGITCPTEEEKRNIWVATIIAKDRSGWTGHLLSEDSLQLSHLDYLALHLLHLRNNS